MLVVGLRTTEDKRFSTYSRAQLLSGELPVFPTLGINVRSIADSIGVPRETVRRKVRQLIDAGWIDRKGNELRYTSLAYQRLSTTRAAIEQLAIRNYVTVSELMRRRLSGEAPASQAP
jgi:DNA-binding Lrp family transcriptional regulator